MQAQFGFAPAVAVYFGLSRAGDFEAQETAVLRLVLAVLARIPGEALLHVAHEEVWLLRRDGLLTVDDRLWRPDRLALLDQPHERAQLAF